MSTPSWLDDALRETETPDASEDYLATDVSDLYPGDIWIVKGNDHAARLRRHVLVLEAEPSTDVIRVCLLSNETELAAEDDLILPGSLTRLPYDLMVETALITRVAWDQAVRRVGMIENALLDDILDFIWDERPDRLDELRGLPARTRGDGRRQFEHDEVRDLERLGAPVEMPCDKDRVSARFVDASIAQCLSNGALDRQATMRTWDAWREVLDGRAQLCAMTYSDDDAKPAAPSWEGHEFSAALSAALVQAVTRVLCSGTQQKCNVHECNESNLKRIVFPASIGCRPGSSKGTMPTGIRILSGRRRAGPPPDVPSGLLGDQTPIFVSNS